MILQLCAKCHLDGSSPTHTFLFQENINMGLITKALVARGFRVIEFSGDIGDGDVVHDVNWDATERLQPNGVETETRKVYLPDPMSSSPVALFEDFLDMSVGSCMRNPIIIDGQARRRRR
jgi:hypothetical protein